MATHKQVRNSSRSSNLFSILLAWAFFFLLIILTTYQSALGARIPDGQTLQTVWERYLSRDAHKEPLLRFPYEDCFRVAAETSDLPLSLLLAVARGESDFDPRAKSDKSCYGIMQIRWPITAKHLGITSRHALYDPCTNIRAGARYLRELLDRYEGNLHLALAAYNYGPGRISKGIHPNAIPRGARWYSSYIHHHLQYVMRSATGNSSHNAPQKKRSYRPEGKLEIVSFNEPYRARGFYDYSVTRWPSLRFGWFKVGLGRYRVVMLYKNRRELNRGRKVLGRLGFSMREARFLHN